MDEEAFNLSIRKFLKTVGVRSQQEIEKAVRAAIAAKQLSGNEALQATMNLKIGELAVDVDFTGTIDLA
jgi:hypothetical protein